jgi:hypothetical protein
VRDLTRDRKLKAALAAMLLYFLGLVCCLVTAIWVKDSIGLLVGLYTPFGVGIGGALALFINGNVKVHQAQAGSAP